MDISKADQVEAMVAATVKAYGRLDVAVNNAALTPDDKPAHEFDEAYWDRLMDVDLKGTALCLKYELRQLREQAMAARSLTSPPCRASVRSQQPGLRGR